MIFGILIQFDTENSKINIKKAVSLWETVDTPRVGEPVHQTKRQMVVKHQNC